MRLVTLQPEHLETMARHCEHAYPNEGCGILLGHINGELRQVVEVIPTTNSRSQEEGQRRYSIPTEQLLAGELQAEQQDLEVMGYFHSHPDHPACPSGCDLDQAWPDYSYLIVSVREGKVDDVRSWNLRADTEGFTEELLDLT